MLFRVFLSELRLYVANQWIARLPFHCLRDLYYRNVMRFKMGADASIFLGNQFYCAKWLSLGKTSVINENCRLDCRGGISIGDNVIIAANVTILTADHDPSDPSFSRARIRPVVIEDYAFIATGALILPGVTLGRGCMVGAGAVVPKSVPAYSIVVGNPARIVGKRPENLSYSIPYKRLFH